MKLEFDIIFGESAKSTHHFLGVLDPDSQIALCGYLRKGTTTLSAYKRQTDQGIMIDLWPIVGGYSRYGSFLLEKNDDGWQIRPVKSSFLMPIISCTITIATGSG